MSEEVANRFIEALGKLEQTREVNAIADLIAPDAELGNIIAPERFHGPQGAREFWKKYRDTFENVESSFRNRIVTDGHAALEWTTKGSSSESQPFSYDGVSILEIQNDKITRFRAYFDPTALGQQIVPE